MQVSIHLSGEKSMHTVFKKVNNGHEKQRKKVKEKKKCLGMVAHMCNPTYLGGRDWESHSLSPVQTNNSRTPSQPMAGWDGACLSSQPCRQHK
jgi:hypothetical protein